MDAQAWYADLMAKHKREVLSGVEAERAEERRQFEAERRQLEAQLADAQRQAEVRQLVRQFEHRVGRRLSVDEREALTASVATHGSDYLAELVLDLSGPDLAAWLEKNGVTRSD